MVDFLERLFVGKRVKDFGAVQGSADRINVVVAEVKGKRQLLLRASTPGSLRYVYIDPGDVERLSAMLAEARDLLADESACCASRAPESISGCSFRSARPAPDRPVGEISLIQAAFDRALVMERVVRTLLVADGAPDYGQQVELAKERYEDSTPFLGSLLKHLEDQPEDLRALEAVVVLGAACPGAAARHGVEPIEVGRALAPRLIAAGQTLRAERLFEFLCRARPNDERLEHAWNSALRRSGNVDAQVDRYLQLSETEAAEGRPEEAISWLRKALLLDSSRRDIARTIRDLRRTGGQRLQVRLLGRRVIVGVVLAGLVAVAVRHERKARREYASLPQASAGDLGGLEQRLAGLDRMVPGSRIWLGMFDARREQLAVRIQLECLLEAQQAELAIQQDEERAGRLAQANAAQRQARELVSRGSYDEAIEAYALALELAPPDWEHTDRARKDLEAVRVRRAQLEP